MTARLEAGIAFLPEPEPAQQTGGASPGRLALARLLRNRSALAALAFFALVVLACLCGPLYATYVAHTDPFSSNINGTTTIHGHRVLVMPPDGVRARLVPDRADLGHRELLPRRRRPGPRRRRAPALWRAQLAPRSRGARPSSASSWPR